MVFLMLLIRFVASAQHSKILFITFFTVSIFQLHKISFSFISQLLTDHLLTKTKSILFESKASFLVVQTILSMIKNQVNACIKYVLETKGLTEQFSR